MDGERCLERERRRIRKAFLKSACADIVTGKIKGITHYWNRLPDGKEVDFTSCQFGGDGFTPLKKGRKVRERTGFTPLRFLLFAKKVMEQL